MFLSRKMFKEDGESKHPCRTPTIVLNQSPVQPPNWTTLWVLSYRFSMTHMMLALMLYFLIIVHVFELYPVKGLLEVYEDMVEIRYFFAEDPEIEYLFCGVPFHSETSLHFCNDLFCLWQESVKDDLQHDFARMADKTGGLVVLAKPQVAFLWERDN